MDLEKSSVQGVPVQKLYKQKIRVYTIFLYIEYIGKNIGYMDKWLKFLYIRCQKNYTNKNSVYEFPVDKIYKQKNSL